MRYLLGIFVKDIKPHKSDSPKCRRTQIYSIDRAWKESSLKSGTVEASNCG